MRRAVLAGEQSVMQRTAVVAGLAMLAGWCAGCGDDGASGAGAAGSGGAHAGGAAGASGSGGLSGSGGAGGQASAPVCAPAPGGSSGPVQAPVLRQTLAGSWDENWLGSPAVADLDADGVNEIIATRHSVLYVWNADGSLKWKTAWPYGASTSPEHGSSRMWASPVVGNFDADPELEIAVGSDADSSSGMNVAVYDHEGELLPGWPVHFGGADEVRSITAGDLDNDGTAEIVVNKTNAGPATAVFRLDGTMMSGWPQVQSSCDPAPPAEPCWDFGGYNQNIAVGDVDGDGFLDVVSSYDAIGFGVFDRNGEPFATAPGFTDPVITAVEAYHDLALSMQGWGDGDRSEFTYSPPVIADVDGDGKMEYVLVGDHEHTQSTANRGVTFWVLRADLSRPTGWDPPKDTGMPLVDDDKGPNIVATQPSPTVGDLDAAPGLEVLAPAYDGYLYAFAADGTQLWRYSFASTASPYTGASEALLADLNGDGSPEVVFATYSSGEPGKPETPAHLIILDSGGHELVKTPIDGRGSMAAPTIADLDGDGHLELILSLKDALGGGLGGVQIWDLPGSSDNCLAWLTGRGNLMRQGYVPLGGR